MGRPNMACAEGTWKMRCDTIHCILRELIHTPSNKPICHDLTRHSLVRLDRVRTVYGRFKYSMNLMGLSPSHQHRVSAALQARPLTTLSVSVRYTVSAGTWATLNTTARNGLATCSVPYRRIINQTQEEEEVLYTYIVLSFTSERAGIHLQR